MQSEPVTNVVYHPKFHKTMPSKWKNETLYSVTERCERLHYWGFTATFNDGVTKEFVQLADGWNVV